MKRIAVLCSLAFAATVHASFDLMMVADSNNVIHRLDPTTGAYLGSFAGISGYTSTFMAASLSQKKLFTMGGGLLNSYDYSSGVYVAGYGVPTGGGGLAFAPDGKTLYVGSSNSIWKFDVTTGLYTSQLVAGLTSAVTSLTCDPNGNVFATDTSNNLISYSPAGTQMSSISGILPGVTQSAYVAAQGGFSKAVAYTANGSNYGYSLVSGTNILNVSTWNYSNMSQYWGATTAHSGGYMLGKDSASSALRVTAMVPAAFYSGSSFTYSNITSAKAMTIVLAPEPSSMAVMGLGALALLRRRRSR